MTNLLSWVPVTYELRLEFNFYSRETDQGTAIP